MEIIGLLLSKEVLQILGPLLGIGAFTFYVYQRGKRSGENKAVEKYTKSNEKYKKDIKKAEQDNMDLENKKNDKIAEIKNVSGKLVDLIELFNKGTRGGKTSGRKTKKK